MIVLKSDDQINKMHEAGKILASIHRELRDFIRPGISSMEVDAYVEALMIKNGVSPEQKGYQGYQYATCASINDEICHGFPRHDMLLEGDIVTIDMVVNLDGWLADSAWTYGVGEISKEDQDLMDTTKESLYRAIDIIEEGVRLGDIGHCIQSFVESKGYSVVREFVGHGIGKDMHEDPQVLHYGIKNKGIRLQPGMTFTIEPMINAGGHGLTIDDNEWTARTVDGKKSAQYEHTIAIKSDFSVVVLTEQDI